MSNLRFNYFDVDDPSKTRAIIQLWDGDDWLGVIFLRKQDFLPDDDPEPHTPCWQVSGINVLEPFRRKGFGTKLYEEAARVAEKYGKSLCSDTPIALDPKALAFWEKQVEKGRAYWEVPGPSENEGVNYDYGRFVLKQPLSSTLSGNIRIPYYHVTNLEEWAAIQKEKGLRSGDGICGTGVYMWDNLDLAVEYADDLGLQKPVIIKIESDDPISCGEAVGGIPEREGDRAFYEHVFLVPTRKVNQLWKPKKITRLDK